MRGKHFDSIAETADGRITPAYAGKTGGFLPHFGVFQDHPRVCGENYSAALSQGWSVGSPPRMRGKPYPCSQGQRGRRITPAYAGKTALTNATERVQRDHPRVCGENLDVARHFENGAGSPPRMRGKLIRVKKL